jgi:hypothetical protein
LDSSTGSLLVSPGNPQPNEHAVQPVVQLHAGLAALCLMARFHQIGADPALLAHQLGLAPAERVGIVPQAAQMTVEVTLENKDVGFVNVGQGAAIKLETFPFTRYGTIGGEVTRVTADAVTDEKRGAVFPVALALARDHIDVDGKKVRLAPGMNVTAEIKTGKRRVIDYLLSPIQRAGGESLRER